MDTFRPPIGTSVEFIKVVPLPTAEDAAWRAAREGHDCVGLGKTQVHERTGHKTTAKISVHIFSYEIQAGPELSGTEASGDHLDSFILVRPSREREPISEDLLRAVATSTLARVLSTSLDRRWQGILDGICSVQLLGGAHPAFSKWA